MALQPNQGSCLILLNQPTVEEKVERNLRTLDDMMEKWKMRINWRKTKVMTVKRGGGTCNISVKGEKIEEVKTIKFLGYYWSGIKGDWSNENCSPGEKRTEQGNKVNSIQCNGGPYNTVWV